MRINLLTIIALYARFMTPALTTVVENPRTSWHDMSVRWVAGYVKSKKAPCFRDPDPINAITFGKADSMENTFHRPMGFGRRLKRK